MRDRTEADDIVQGAYNRALLDLILPPMRRAAKDAGYAITVHGSLNRDIDLVAVPWREHNVWTMDALVDSLVGAMRGAIGRAHSHNEQWTVKPHGRRAKTLLAWEGENSANIDLSVMPAIREGRRVMTTVAPVNQRASVPAVRKTQGWDDAPPGTWGFYSTEAAGSQSGMLFQCPCGCDSMFSVAIKQYPGCGPVWQWDGNEESPTVTPSILIFQMNDKGERTGEHWHGFLTAGEFRSC